MELVSIDFTPRKKGGKRIKLYYCMSCASAARAKATTIHDKQDDILLKVENRRKRIGRKEKK